MKKLVLLSVVLLFTCSVSFAQDTIVKQNDEIVIGTVYRLSPEYIYYTPTGETYPTSKSILREEVKDIRNLVFNYNTLINVDSALMHKHIELRQSGLGSAMFIGERRLSNHELKGLLMNYPLTYNKYTSGRGMKLLGAILSISGGVFVGAGFLVASGGDQVNMPILALGGVALISGIAFSNGGNKKIKKAIGSYNSLIDEEPKVAFSFGIQSNGLGFRLNF